MRGRIIRKVRRYSARDTVAVVRLKVEEDRWSKNGCICPICDGRIVVRRRSITPMLAEFLIWLVAEYLKKQTWVKAWDWPGFSKAKKHGGDIYRLRFWGLIRRHGVSTIDENKKATVIRTDGRMKPTKLGYRFARGRIELPRSAYIYRSMCLELGGDPITIDEILSRRRKFDVEDIKVGGKP